MTPEDIQKIITSEYLNQFGALNAHDYKKIPPEEWTLKAAKKIHEEFMQELRVGRKNAQEYYLSGEYLDGIERCYDEIEQQMLRRKNEDSKSD